MCTVNRPARTVNRAACTVTRPACIACWRTPPVDERSARGQRYNRAPMRPPGLNIVAIGGGTGLSTLLRGLKRYVGAEGPWTIDHLGAIVTVTDEGGSSGELRREFE